MSQHVNDGALEAVLRNTGNIDAFLDEYFCFLARRTDFFVVTPPEGGTMGFPAGVAAQLIISKFKKWQEFHVLHSSTKSAEGAVDQLHVARPSPAVAIVKPEPKKSVETSGSKAGKKVCAVEPKPGRSSQNVSSQRNRQEPTPSNTFNTHNGNKTDKYSWSQSLTELDVHVVVDRSVRRKTDLKVEILMKKLRVLVPGASNPVVIDLELADTIIKDESFWSLYPGESVFFSLQKVNEKWWDHLFEGEEPIDRTAIEAERPMEELGEEERAKIEQVVYNQEQKLKGQPTIEEKKLEDIMKTAWNASGSPFMGQPFDMSRIQVGENTITTVNVPPET